MHMAWSAAGKEREHALHARYDCVKPRYPSFWTGKITISEEVKERLTPKHKAHMYEMFSLSVQEIS